MYNVYIYIYICVCVCMYVYIYIANNITSSSNDNHKRIISYNPFVIIVTTASNVVRYINYKGKLSQQSYYSPSGRPFLSYRYSQP